MQGSLAVAIGERLNPKQHRYVVPLPFACCFLLSALLLIANCLLTAVHSSASVPCSAQHGTAKAVLSTASATQGVQCKARRSVEFCLKESKATERHATQQRGTELSFVRSKVVQVTFKEALTQQTTGKRQSSGINDKYCPSRLRIPAPKDCGVLRR